MTNCQIEFALFKVQLAIANRPSKPQKSAVYLSLINQLSVRPLTRNQSRMPLRPHLLHSSTGIAFLKRPNRTDLKIDLSLKAQEPRAKGLTKFRSVSMEMEIINSSGSIQADVPNEPMGI